MVLDGIPRGFSVASFLGRTATEIVDSEHIVSQVRSFCRPATDKFEFVGIIDTQERDQKVKLTWVSPFFCFLVLIVVHSSGPVESKTAIFALTLPS